MQEFQCNRRTHRPGLWLSRLNIQGAHGAYLPQIPRLHNAGGGRQNNRKVEKKLNDDLSTLSSGRERGENRKETSRDLFGFKRFPSQRETI